MGGWGCWPTSCFIASLVFTDWGLPPGVDLASTLDCPESWESRVFLYQKKLLCGIVTSLHGSRSEGQECGRGADHRAAVTAHLVQVIGQATRRCSQGSSSLLARLPRSIWTTCSALWPCLALRSPNQVVEQMSEWRTDFYISWDDSTLLPGFFLFYFFHFQSKDKAVISVHPGLPRWCSGKESVWQCGRHGFDPGSGRSPGEGNGNPPQYSCLESPMDRVA